MTHKKQYRYFYFKNGDVVAQVQRVISLNGQPPDGGPDAFIADFLEKGQVGEVVVAAFLDRDQEARHGNIRAMTYSNVGGKQRLKTLIRLPADILSSKPQRILCGRQGYALAICLLTGLLLRAPVIFSAHNRLSGQATGIKGQLRNGIDTWLIRHCHAAICHGPYLAQELADIGLAPQRITIFDSGCADLCPETDDTQTSPAWPPRILYLGRMVREKGVFDLLDAFNRLITAGQQAELVFAGDGADKDALEQRARELGVQAHTRFLGAIPHADIGPLIQSAWSMVTPTRSEFPEGRCMSAMEALAIGVPVVAPNAGPFPYLVRHGENGLLFEQDSVQGIATALERLTCNQELRAQLSQRALAERSALLNPEISFGEAVLTSFEG